MDVEGKAAVKGIFRAESERFECAFIGFCKGDGDGKGREGIRKFRGLRNGQEGYQFRYLFIDLHVFVNFYKDEE